MSKRINDIRYADILKESWQITWKHKFLWWFGLFLALTGSISWNGPNIQGEGGKTKIEGQIASFISQHAGLVAGVIIILAILFVLFLILGIMARGGAIKSINNVIAKKEPLRFKEGMREGKKYFWQIFMIGFFTLISFVLASIVLLTPVLFLFLAGSYVMGVLLATTAAIIIVPLAVLAFFINVYGYLYIVLSDLSARQAFESAYDLLAKNIAPSIVMGIILIPIGIILGLVIMAIFLFFALAFGLTSGLVYLILGKIGAIVIAALGFIVFLALFLAIRSVYEIFTQTAWILFFRELAAPEEETKEILEEIAEETNTIIPAAGGAVKTASTEE